LLTPTPDADANLLREGIDSSRIVRVDNAMIDTLRTHLDQARARGVVERMGLTPSSFALVTLHRPSNVDDPAQLSRLLDALAQVSSRLPVVFPVHPRTRARISALGSSVSPALRLVEPLGYLDFLALEADARVVLTDSGGIQEETTALGVPCLTLRTSTERPITVTEGTNIVVGADPGGLLAHVEGILVSGGKAGRVPELWDGHTGPRVASALSSLWSGRPAGME